ncbi:hypothetical protein CAPTEDRAFT_227848 [Capitella teleta]|uniref:SAP domain-containing protein n=1 Tax=Capitella teleta TaxID=283909 RepID=R7UG22_CAPTE|nr:hypothetical protein CAPTEDRAFT_227848 [Capitella teleta]|eukprot:ELU02237.1 hypothetical protein CAPTEDRAFT_227848 [Capitella teleta]
MSSETATSQAWSKKTVTQLKEELTKRQLDVSGKKADLIARLVAHESNGREEKMEEKNGEGEEGKVEEEEMEEEAQEEKGAEEEGGEDEEEEEVVGTDEVDYDELMEDQTPMEEETNVEDSQEEFKKEDEEQPKEEVTEEKEEKFASEAGDGGGEEEVAIAELHEDDDSDGDDQENESWKRQDSKKAKKEDGKEAVKVECNCRNIDASGYYIFKLLDSGTLSSECHDYCRRRKLMVNPLSMDDLSRPEVLSCFEQCSYFQVRFRSIRDDAGQSTWEGMIEMDFKTVRNAKEAEELLPKVNEKFKAKRLLSRKPDAVWPSAGKDEIKVGPWQNTLFVTKVPDEVDDLRLCELFPSASLVAVPLKNDKPAGYAYVQFPTMDEALTVMRDHPDGIQLSDGVRASVLAVWLRREPLNDKYLRALFPQDDDHSKKCALLNKVHSDVHKDILLIQDQLNRRSRSNSVSRLRQTLAQLRSQISSNDRLKSDYVKSLKKKEDEKKKAEEKLEEGKKEDKKKEAEVEKKADEAKEDDKKDKKSRDHSRDRSRDRSRNRRRSRSRDRKRERVRPSRFDHGDLRKRIRKSRSRERTGPSRMRGARGMMATSPRRDAAPLRPMGMGRAGSSAPPAAGLAQMISQVGSGGATVQDLVSFMQQQQQQQQQMPQQHQHQPVMQQQNQMAMQMMAMANTGGMMPSSDRFRDDHRDVQPDVFNRLGRHEEAHSAPVKGRPRQRSPSPQRNKRIRPQSTEQKFITEPESKTVNLLVQLSDMLNNSQMQGQMAPGDMPPDMSTSRSPVRGESRPMTSEPKSDFRAGASSSAASYNQFNKYPNSAGQEVYPGSSTKVPYVGRGFGSDQYEPDKPTEDSFSDMYGNARASAGMGANYHQPMRGTDYDARSAAALSGVGFRAGAGGGVVMGGGMGLQQGGAGGLIVAPNPRAVPRPFAPSRQMPGGQGGGGGYSF